MAITDDPCLAQNIGRRRIFWTTRLESCGRDVLCGSECGIPGLEYLDLEGPDAGPNGPGRTIKNDEWLHSLVLNILNTRARTDAKCPAPTAVFGHWSESYRDDGLYIGSTLWNAAARPYIRVADSVKAIAAAIKADMAKLVVMRVANRVDVEATYRGRNAVDVVVTAVTINDRHVLNLSGTLAQDTWAWH